MALSVESGRDDEDERNEAKILASLDDGGDEDDDDEDDASTLNELLKELTRFSSAGREYAARSNASFGRSGPTSSTKESPMNVKELIDDAMRNAAEKNSADLSGREYAPSESTRKEEEERREETLNTIRSSNGARLGRNDGSKDIEEIEDAEEEAGERRWKIEADRFDNARDGKLILEKPDEAKVVNVEDWDAALHHEHKQFAKFLQHSQDDTAEKHKRLEGTQASSSRMRLSPTSAGSSSRRAGGDPNMAILRRYARDVAPLIDLNAPDAENSFQWFSMADPQKSPNRLVDFMKRYRTLGPAQKMRRKTKQKTADRDQINRSRIAERAIDEGRWRVLPIDRHNPEMVATAHGTGRYATETEKLSSSEESHHPRRQGGKRDAREQIFLNKCPAGKSGVFDNGAHRATIYARIKFDN
eukprot:g2866.t1